MAMAMSAWRLGFHFSAAATDNSLRVLEKPIFCVPFLNASSGFVSTKPCYFLHKRR